MIFLGNELKVNVFGLRCVPMTSQAIFFPNLSKQLGSFVRRWAAGSQSGVFSQIQKELVSSGLDNQSGRNAED